MAKLLRPRGKSSTKGLLDELEYKALDLEAASLYSTLSSLASIEGESVTTSLQDHIPTRRVSVSGLHATYDEGLAFLKEENARLTRRPSVTLSSPDISPAVHPERLPDVIDEEDEDEGDAAQSLPSQRPCAGSSNGARKTSIVWLGSSIGNFTREEAVDFLKEIDLAPGDTMLIGVDGCSDGPAIEIAYNDPEVTSDRRRSRFYVLAHTYVSSSPRNAGGYSGFHPRRSRRCWENASPRPRGREGSLCVEL